MEVDKLVPEAGTSLSTSNISRGAHRLVTGNKQCYIFVLLYFIHIQLPEHEFWARENEYCETPPSFNDSALVGREKSGHRANLVSHEYPRGNVTWHGMATLIYQFACVYKVNMNMYEVTLHGGSFQLQRSATSSYSYSVFTVHACR